MVFEIQTLLNPYLCEESVLLLNDTLLVKKVESNVEGMKSLIKVLDLVVWCLWSISFSYMCKCKLWWSLNLSLISFYKLSREYNLWKKDERRIICQIPMYGRGVWRGDGKL